MKSEKSSLACGVRILAKIEAFEKRPRGLHRNLSPLPPPNQILPFRLLDLNCSTRKSPFSRQGRQYKRKDRLIKQSRPKMSQRLRARHGMVDAVDPNDPGNTRQDPWGEQMKYSQGIGEFCFPQRARREMRVGHGRRRSWERLRRHFKRLQVRFRSGN